MIVEWRMNRICIILLMDENLYVDFSTICATIVMKIKYIFL